MKKYLLLSYCLIALLVTPRATNTLSLCGYQLSSPIGIAACPLTTGTGVKELAAYGYDVVTYKTIRSSSWPINSNELYAVNIDRQLNAQDFYGTFHACDTQSLTFAKAITNCYGICSADPQTASADIAHARAQLSEKQLLIVSVYGSGATPQAQIDDFVAAAQIAAAGNAHIIEANLSCPNLNNVTYLYKDPDFVMRVCKAISTHIPTIPLIIKVGCFDTAQQARAVIRAAHAGGAQGICGINAMPAHIIAADGKPVYGAKHTISGISGAPLFSMTIEFVKTVRSIIDQEGIAFALLATGGVTKAEDFDALLAAGADIALCATGAMRNKKLALEYHESHMPQCSPRKKELIKKLYAIGAFKIGNFVFKSGMQSPSYFDMRLIISYPKLLNAIADELANMITILQPDLVCGVPYAAVPLATLVSSKSNIPMIMPRKESKSHGTKKAIEGECKAHDTCIVIEDVIVSGSSIEEAINVLEKSGLIVKDIIVLIDRAQGGSQLLTKKGYHVHALFTLSDIIQVLLAENCITHKQYATIADFAVQNRVDQ